MAALTRFQKKLVSFIFLLIVACVLLTNAFITMWIITAVGINSVSYYLRNWNMLVNK